jgi:HEAT repeat protein
MNELMEPLTRYDWGGERASLYGIDLAIQEAQGDPARLAELEQGLIEVLQATAPLPAKEYACRQLALMGSAACVPALTGLLPDPELLDRALLALQAIPDPAAATALREALNTATGAARIGIVNALGERRDKEAISALSALAGEPDPLVQGAVTSALRKIGPA